MIDTFDAGKISVRRHGDPGTSVGSVEGTGCFETDHVGAGWEDHGVVLDARRTMGWC
jgi:hypothetical protein